MRTKFILISLITFLTFNTTAADTLAIKKGPFKKYHKCTLLKSSGTIEISNGLTYKLIETSDYHQSLYDLENLVMPAISGIQTRTHRWYPTQTDYLIRNSRGSLINFYAKGFTNISNESIEAEVLINRIDKICNNQLSDFNILGHFEIDFKVGTKVFKDKLIIRRIEEFNGANISGSYIVPNSFESKVQNLNYKNGDFSFIIHVQENEDDYKAVFEGFLHSNGKIEGKAFILPNRKELGIFTGRKI